MSKIVIDTDNLQEATRLCCGVLVATFDVLRAAGDDDLDAVEFDYGVKGRKYSIKVTRLDDDQ